MKKLILLTEEICDCKKDIIERIEKYKTEFGRLPEKVGDIDLDGINIDLDAIDYFPGDSSDIFLEIKESEAYKKAKSLWE